MPRCADVACGRWRPTRVLPGWATGLRYNGHWFCSRACVEHAARAGFERPAIAAPAAATLPPLRLGVLLRHAGVLSEKDLHDGLEMQRASGQRLGKALCWLRAVDPDAVLRALAVQAGVSYLAAFDVTRVRRGPVRLSADTARALGLIPFEYDEARRHMQVVCTAPVPRAAVRALQQLTGWTADVFLVHDEVWEQARQRYAAGDAADAATVASVDAAAARVADAAQAQRSITVRSATTDRFTWVRIEGARQVSDLLVPAGAAATLEDACLAAPIAR